MNAISGAVGPVVSRTPADVLALIFMASVPDDNVINYGYAMFPRPFIHQSPLVLGRVCRLWREVSLATPQLWCKIQLGDMNANRHPHANPHIHNRRDLGRESVTLQEWLRRSGNCPLSIGICYEGRNETDMDLFKKIIEVAILYVRRWKNFTLHSAPTVFSWKILLPLLDTASLLESLHILADDEIYAEWKISSRDIQPYLITGMKDDPASMILTRHHHIRILSASMTIEQFRLCISHCPVLEKLLVTLQSDPSLLTTTIVNDTYIAPHLTKLSLSSVTSSDSIGPCLALISCPLLNELSITQNPVDDEQVTSWPHLASFLKRSRPPLKTLDLQYLSMALQNLLDCFKEVPSLKSLSLDVMVVPDELFRILQLAPGIDQPLLPTLQKLAVSENLVDNDARTLTAFVLSRWNCHCMPEYSKGKISEHSPDCQSFQTLSIGTQVIGRMRLVEIIEKGFNLIIGGGWISPI